MGNEKYRAAIYIRVANYNQLSANAQASVVESFARENGYKDIKTYTDNGASGLNFNRPALLEMEADIKAGNINMVIAQNISRIGRDFIETEIWINGLEKQGVEFVTADGSYEEYRRQRQQLMQSFSM